MKDALGDKFKRHEIECRSALQTRVPVVVRVDGKAFHTYTRKLHAHDPNMAAGMWAVAEALCAEIMGARFAYTQSDEVSVLINPWSAPGSECWFAHDVQKVVSVCASIAAATLTARSPTIFGEVRPAYFDARIFAVPTEEVPDYFVWRQLDAHRNAVNGLAQEHFSGRQLHGLKQSAVREMLREAGHPFEALPKWVQRGQLTRRVKAEIGGDCVRAWWESDAAPWFLEPEWRAFLADLVGEVVPADAVRRFGRGGA